MNCANHPEAAATAYCRTCGKPLCQICQKSAQGTVFCEEHFVAAAAPNPYTTPPPSPYASPYAGPVNPAAPSPGLAFILGLFIPGVGAIYNGQYAKGLIHVLILGLLISIMGTGAASGLEPLIAISIAVFVFYMAFEAYHTALKRQRGEPVDEFSSILPAGGPGRGFPVGPLVLIALGVIFLLETLNVLRLYQIVRFWPVFLIMLGCYMLYARTRGVGPGQGRAGSEAGHER